MRIETTKEGHDFMLAAPDSLSLAITVVALPNTVLFANAAMDEIFAEGTLIRFTNGTIKRFVTTDDRISSGCS